MSDSFHTGFVAIVGRPNVGKSTLLNHLIGQKISITSRKAQTTRHRVTGIYTDAQAQFIFVDTPGFQTQFRSVLNRAMNRAVTSALQDVDVVVFVIEALRFGPRDQQVLQLMPENRPVVLAVNKMDTVDDKPKLMAFLAEMQERFPFAAIVPLSAEKAKNLDQLLLAIRPHLPEMPAIYAEDDITDRNERFLAAEFIREKLFRQLGDEIPYTTAVEIEKFEQEGALRRIHAAIIVDKAAQKAIVIGKNGEKIKRVATDARLEMEKLFDGKVYLELWVKVKSGWADDARVVKSLGYDES